MKKYGAPRSIVTDGLRAYSAAMNEIGVAAERHEVGGRLNNRAENSHQPFRRRERDMLRFRRIKTLQKFSSVHAQVHNHFNLERHLVTREVYKQRIPLKKSSSIQSDGKLRVLAKGWKGSLGSS
jgi:putative transposase